jgi:hypothetical protein
MTSLARTKDATLQDKVETLRRQLADSQACEASLWATIKEAWPALSLTDRDIERIVAAMLRQRSLDRREHSFTDTYLESDQRSLKQPDLPLLSDSKDLTYTSWSILVQAKLQDNNDHFPSKKSKLTYVYGRTTEAAQAYLEP